MDPPKVSYVVVKCCVLNFTREKIMFKVDTQKQRVLISY
jgi:hypothetical protein